MEVPKLLCIDSCWFTGRDIVFCLWWMKIFNLTSDMVFKIITGLWLFLKKNCVLYNTGMRFKFSNWLEVCASNCGSRLMICLLTVALTTDTEIVKFSLRHWQLSNRQLSNRRATFQCDTNWSAVLTRNKSCLQELYDQNWNCYSLNLVSLSSHLKHLIISIFVKLAQFPNTCTAAATIQF